MAPSAAGVTTATGSSETEPPPQRLSPVQVLGITDAVQVTTGAYHTCVRRLTGAVTCFGDNQLGQLGDGTAQGKLTPTTVPGISGAVKMASGFGHTCVVSDNQVVQCWGQNTSGELADGTIANKYKPVVATVQ